jgi:N-acetylglutamate synthase-like GNAT family acetyltransferase
VAVQIREAEPAELGAVRELIKEYVRALGIDLGFQEIESELDDLATAYGPPGGRILVALVDGEIAGCVGLRPLEQDCCEMKRLYVRPAFRGTGLGKRLALAVIETAGELGYERMRIDTLPQMGAARKLYASLGFREIEPYRFNPVPGTAFMELALP